MLNKKFKIGDMIRWYVSYADDPDLIRDGGLGLLLCTRQPALEAAPKLFDVYRFKNNDIITLTMRDIEHIKE